MLKLIIGIILGVLMLAPNVGMARAVVIAPGSTKAAITGYSTPENTIGFTANNEEFGIDDLWADSPEGIKLIARLEELIKTKQQVEINYAVVQPVETNQYSYKVAMSLGTFSGGLYYAFDKTKSYLKIDPLSDVRFLMINDYINLEKGKSAKEATIKKSLDDQNRMVEVSKQTNQQQTYSVPSFKSPYDIPSKAVLQAFLYNLIGINTPVERGSVIFKQFKTTNNYTRKLNDETVYILDVSALVDIYPLDLNTNTIGSTPQQPNRTVQGEIPFIKRGSKWFAFNDFAKKWLELPSQ